MSKLAFILLCFQACLVQNAFSQCLTPGAGVMNGLGLEYGGIVPAIAGLAPGPYGLAPGLLATEAYGGAGVGEVTVFGEMPVAGSTLVSGQVPILGAVRFAGEIPAAGVVTITGSCGCGCGNPAYIY